MAKPRRKVQPNDVYKLLKKKFKGEVQQRKLLNDAIMEVHGISYRRAVDAINAAIEAGTVVAEKVHRRKTILRCGKLIRKWSKERKEKHREKIRNEFRRKLLLARYKAELTELAQMRKKFGAVFFKPYDWQERFIDGVRNHNIAISASSNKRGKTAVGCNIVVSWVLGYEPWSRIKEPQPGYIEIAKGYHRESSLGIKPPVNIIIVGEDWKLHIGKTLVPELKKWAPVGQYKTKKNEQGVEYYWEFNNGSTITIMCYSQDDDLFESSRAQAVWFDEPPPKPKFDAMARALLLDRGKTMMTMTPLKEPWILDEIILSGRKDVYIDEGNILDNLKLRKDEEKLLRKAGLTDVQIQQYFNLVLYDDPVRQTPVQDKGKAAEAYLESIIPPEHHDQIYKLKVLKFIRDIDPSEVAPRVFGKFRSLVGRVLKEFSPSTHMIEPFEVPTDWPVVPMIDFHLSTPQAISYWAVSPQDIYYCVGETWANISAEQIADDIIRKKITNAWNIHEAFIDPLSKGDTSYIRNRAGNVQDSFTIIYNKLADHDITLDVASKDKVSGIRNIQTRLVGVNGLPTLYIFNTCQRHLYEIMRWTYDDNGLPSKDCDHFMENMYRFTLTGTKYDSYKVQPVIDHIPRTEVAWLAA